MVATDNNLAEEHTQEQSSKFHNSHDMVLLQQEYIRPYSAQLVPSIMIVLQLVDTLQHYYIQDIETDMLQEFVEPPHFYLANKLRFLHNTIVTLLQ